jgi:DNA-binding MarR family transcriptional regulator
MTAVAPVNGCSYTQFMSAEPDLLATTACLCLASRRAARAITREFDSALRPHGLRATQFSLLSALSLHRESRVGDLATLLGLERTTLTRNLAVVEALGLVESAPGEDRRERRYTVSAKGRRTLQRALAGWAAMQSRLTGQLGMPAADSLRRLSGGPSVLLQQRRAMAPVS